MDMRHTRPRIFVARLSGDVDESALHEFFSRWCTVHGAWVVRDKGTGISKNFGFVEIEPSDVGVALELDNFVWNGRSIIVKMAHNQ